MQKFMTPSSLPRLKNILIVDDQPESLKDLPQLLTNKGYTVHQAMDSETAIFKANSAPPDLILLDIVMPEMDGYQVCQTLQKLEQTKEIPIIFMSGLNEVKNKVKGFQLGCVDYITKPFEVEEIIARINVHLKLYQNKKALKAKNKRLKQVIKQRGEVEKQLTLLHEAIAACGNGVLITDAKQKDNPIIYVNPTFERMTGYSFNEAKGKNPRFLQGRDRRQPNLAVIREAVHQGKSCQVVLRNYHKNGEFYWHEVFVSPIRNKRGEVTHFVGIQNDISDRKKIEEALIRSEQKFASAFRASPDPIAISTLAEGRFVEVNQSFCQLTEYTKEEVINQTALDLNLWVNEQSRLALCQTLQTEQAIADFELQLRSKFGEIKTLLLSAELIELENEPCILTIAKDITERQKIKKALEKANIELYRLANLDGLTQVANRRRFDETLKTEWQRCYREKQFISLIICDVDEFKRYNDYYEHLRGDDCLIKVAQAIDKGIRRATDLVSRYGGEEFAVILPNTNEEGAIQVAKNIQDQICDLKIPHANSTVSSYLTISIGVASLIPEADLNPTRLIKLADKALFDAKKQGRNRIIISK
jgi:diguanylate cyclase (GGDEF)-like protein/PAS domain S-box-containing protein